MMKKPAQAFACAGSVSKSPATAGLLRLYDKMVLGDEKMLERGKMDRGVIEIVDTELGSQKGHLLKK